MKRLVAWIQGFAQALGGPGLFIIGYLDASFLSFPEVNDLLIIWMVSQHKERFVYYTAMATAGSVLGCLTLYYIARKGGEAFLRRRFSARHIESGLRLFQKYGLLAVVIPALLPPPAPFKIFVLMGGVANIPLKTFVTAIALGRGVRYFGEGILAVLYGKQALEYIHENSRTVGLVLGLLVLAGGVGYYVWKKRTQPT